MDSQLGSDLVRMNYGSQKSKAIRTDTFCWY